MQVYTDTARDDDIVAMGWVIVLDNGEQIEGSRYLIGSYTSMEGEYFALLDGLRFAKQYGRGDIEVYTDCKPLITKIRSPDKSDLWYDRREGAHRLLDKFDSWEINWTPRRNNETADRLAYEALERGR